MIAARIGKPIKVMLAVQLIGALSGAEVISGSAEPRILVKQGTKTKRHSKTNHQNILLFYPSY